MDEREAGLAMIGVIFFCAISGGGIGVFFEQPVIGALIGAVFGMVFGYWLVPRLMQDPR